MTQLITFTLAPASCKQPKDKEEYAKQYIHHKVPAQNKDPCAHNESHCNQSQGELGDRILDVGNLPDALSRSTKG